MAAMRPRGDAASSPVTRYVGQWGRHRPQLTHEASSASIEVERHGLLTVASGPG